MLETHLNKADSDAEMLRKSFGLNLTEANSGTSTALRAALKAINNPFGDSVKHFLSHYHSRPSAAKTVWRKRCRKWKFPK
jgi:hypothetical protein